MMPRSSNCGIISCKICRVFGRNMADGDHICLRAGKGWPDLHLRTDKGFVVFGVEKKLIFFYRQSHLFAYLQTDAGGMRMAVDEEFVKTL